VSLLVFERIAELSTRAKYDKGMFALTQVEEFIVPLMQGCMHTTLLPNIQSRLQCG
jgi:hypothetical protein